jgi:hypothetical protein
VRSDCSRCIPRGRIRMRLEIWSNCATRSAQARWAHPARTNYCARAFESDVWLEIATGRPQQRPVRSELTNCTSPAMNYSHRPACRCSHAHEVTVTRTITDFETSSKRRSKRFEHYQTSHVLFPPFRISDHLLPGKFPVANPITGRPETVRKTPSLSPASATGNSRSWIDGRSMSSRRIFRCTPAICLEPLDLGLKADYRLVV